MIRYVLAAVLASGAVTAALAQDASAPRRELMKTMAAAHYGVIGSQARGRQPYDQAKVDAAFATLAQNIGKVPSVFTPESNTGPSPGSDYYARPNAFEPAAKADIEAKVAAVTKAIEDNRGNAKDVPSLLAAFTAINNACNACHSVYQARKS